MKWVGYTCNIAIALSVVLFGILVVNWLVGNEEVATEAFRATLSAALAAVVLDMIKNKGR